MSKLIASSDIVGLFGQPLQSLGLYPQISQLELIGWRHLNLAKIIKSNQITGLHGRLGPYRGLKIKLINQFLIPTPHLIKLAPLLPQGYILLHQPEAQHSQQLILKHQKTIPLLLVENINSSGSLQSSVNLVNQFQCQGLNAGLMIDLLHLLVELGHPQQPLSSTWPRLIATIGKANPTGFHLPIGSDDDSLPLRHLKHHHWQSLAKVISQVKPQYLVIENHHRHSRFFLQPTKTAYHQSRNQRIMAMLRRFAIMK